MKAYLLGAIWAAEAAAALEAVGVRAAFTTGPANRRTEVLKKRDRRRTDSARGARRGRRPGRQKPLARPAIARIELLEGGIERRDNWKSHGRQEYFGLFGGAIQLILLNDC